MRKSAREDDREDRFKTGGESPRKEKPKGASWCATWCGALGLEKRVKA
jgi:hypothetical protein